ncbi:MAG: hypothetical protein Q8P12_00880 [bacterium]|nr:hypothetical protein [bacterium]
MQDLPIQKQPPIAKIRLPDREIQRIRDLIGSFLIALRNYALYSEDHSICRNATAALQGRLAGYLAEYGFLRLEVEKDRFLCDGEVIHQGPPQDDYLPLQLFRGGVQWLEFQSGLTTEELSAFFRLLIRYRTPKEDAEDDLITALWESGFPHLQYGKEDILWKAEPPIDLSLLKTGPGQAREVEEAGEPAAPVTKIQIPVADPAFWRLTPDEEKAIQEMVLDEETRDSTEDVLEVLTIILREQRDPKDFSVILDFLVEEFGYALAQGEFFFVLKFLESFDALQEEIAPTEPWALPLLDDFRRKISSPEVLGALEQVWPSFGVMEDSSREALRRVLLRFPADAVLTLGPMLAKIDLPAVEGLLWEIIMVLAGRDLQPLVRLLDGAEEPLIRKLIPLLRKMEGQIATDLLFGLTRHPSDPVRRDAIQTLLLMDPENLRRLFPLIEDPQPSVRGLILGHLGRKMNPLAEELLLNYLEKGRVQIKARQHILACYRALGQCGSSRSLPFLRDSLLKQDWKAFLGIGDTLQRQGAALALVGMPDEEDAKTALDRASRSFFSGVRSSYRRAVKEERKRRKEGGR